MPKNKISFVCVWILQIVVASILFQAAMAKFTNAPHAVAIFTKIGIEPHGRMLIGVLELIVAIFLLVPHGYIYGAVLGLGIMTGAIIGHLTDIGIEGLPMAGGVFLACLGILYIRRRESSIFKNMFNK